MTTNADIVACARTLLGVRYRHQGRSRVHGIDCMGLLIVVMRELALARPDFDINGYPSRPDGTLFPRLDKDFDEGGCPTLAGTVLAMQFDGQPHHVGIASDIGVIHVYAQIRRCVEHRLDAEWMKRICRTYTFPGAHYEH